MVEKILRTDCVMSLTGRTHYLLYGSRRVLAYDSTGQDGSWVLQHCFCNGLGLRSQVDMTPTLLFDIPIHTHYMFGGDNFFHLSGPTLLPLNFYFSFIRSIYGDYITFVVYMLWELCYDLEFGVCLSYSIFKIVLFFRFNLSNAR